MDKRMERRVWQRVYGGGMPRKIPMQELQKCLNRTRTNLQFYERRTNDPVYGEAFSRLAAECEEQCKMLRRIMEG